MEAPDSGLIVVVASLLLAGVAVPLAVIAVYHRRKRTVERTAGRRRKERIRL